MVPAPVNPPAHSCCCQGKRVLQNPILHRTQHKILQVYQETRKAAAKNCRLLALSSRKRTKKHTQETKDFSLWPFKQTICKNSKDFVLPQGPNYCPIGLHPWSWPLCQTSTPEKWVKIVKTLNFWPILYSQHLLCCNSTGSNLCAHTSITPVAKIRQWNPCPPKYLQESSLTWCNALTHSRSSLGPKNDNNAKRLKKRKEEASLMRDSASLLARVSISKANTSWCATVHAKKQVFFIITSCFFDACSPSLLSSLNTTGCHFAMILWIFKFYFSVSVVSEVFIKNTSHFHSY